MPYVGSNDIKDGVTIDLRQMRNTFLCVDTRTALVEPGAK